MGSGVRVRELDGLRGVAVLAVMLFHANLLPGGALGVDLFFVLSGYLITGLCQGEIEATGALDFGRFLRRRARRLLPALALLLAVYVAAAPVMVPAIAPIRWVEAGLASVALINFALPVLALKGGLGHTWSLAIEWQFYLLWPLALVALRGLSRTRIAWLVLAVWAALTVARGAWLGVGWSADAAYFFTPFHIGGLLLGSAMALKPKAPMPVWLAVLVLAAACVVPHSAASFGWTLPASELAAAALVLRPPAVLAWPPLAWLGRVSYGVYLWHIPVWLALWRVPEPMRPWLLFPISVALAALSFYTVEAWFRRRNRQPIPAALPA